MVCMTVSQGALLPVCGLLKITWTSQKAIGYNILQTDETKIELLFFFHLNEKFFVWRKKNTAFQYKNLILSVKHGGGCIMVWTCFAASGQGRLAIIDGTINSAF